MRPDIDHLEALDNAATPGPWVADGQDLDNQTTYRDKVYLYSPTANEPVLSGDLLLEDARLVVALRQAIPDLIAYVRELERAIDRLYETACGALKGEDGLRVAKTLACIANHAKGDHCLICADARAQEFTP